MNRFKFERVSDTEIDVFEIGQDHVCFSIDTQYTGGPIVSAHFYLLDCGGPLFINEALEKAILDEYYTQG
jgi:hypothetical protein